MSKVAVLIPCYNEAQTIGKVVTDYRAALPDATVYVYDNNSTDGSDALAREAGAVVGYERLQGKGNVVRTMFREIDADVYVLTDADDAFPADIAPPLIEQVARGEFDMIIGDRLSGNYSEENKRAFHSFGNRLVRGLVNLFFKGDVKDILSGFRVVSRPFVKTFPVMSPGFELETEMTIHALDNRFKIRSVPVNFTERPAGNDSKLNTYRDGGKVLMKIFNMFKDYKPMAFFGILSLVFLAASLVFLIPEFIYFVQELVARSVPKLVLAVFLLLAAFQSFICGLFLEAGVKQARASTQVQINLLLEIARRAPQ
ncbi:MAG: glycosyltransferase family 2 protein [Clostridiales Family XIII bacterium]|jgi:glycosyltransferase involved in cell wall biosynthesis|nr:glycosyltransferase family 2 protein [Clostridiales Family XIII bacterium]